MNHLLHLFVPPFLVSAKKHHVQQNVHNTVVLPSKFCVDIIFSLGNIKLFASFFHITAVKRCHSQIVMNTNCTPTFMDSKMKLNMLEVIFAICFTVQNVWRSHF
jgi:hypothetical protein